MFKYFKPSYYKRELRTYIINIVDERVRGSIGRARQEPFDSARMIDRILRENVMNGHDDPTGLFRRIEILECDVSNLEKTIDYANKYISELTSKIIKPKKRISKILDIKYGNKKNRKKSSSR